MSVLVLVLGVALAGCVGESEIAADEEATEATEATGVTEQASFPTPACSQQTLCCNQLTPVALPSTATLLQLLGLYDPGLSGLVGLQCSPLAENCTAQPACCASSQLGGLVALGCAPISL